MAQIVAYPWETDTEAWARVRRDYYDHEYQRIIDGLSSIQPNQAARQYFSTWTPYAVRMTWLSYCRPVEFIFRAEYLVYEAVVSYARARWPKDLAE